MRSERYHALLLAAALVAAPAAAAPWLGSWGFPSAPVPAGAKAQPVVRRSPTPPAPVPIDNPGGLEVVANPAGDLTDVTVRQLVRVSVGGDRLRIHLGNEAGSEALLVDAVHVGLAGPDGSTVPGTDRPVRFDGAAAVSVPSWAPYDSDPVALAVRPLTRLIVTMRLRSPVGHGGHTLYQYVTDSAGPARLAKLNALVTRVDVAPVRACGAIVTLGDSITEGAHSTANAFRSWPDRLAERLAAARPGWAVVNAGIGGNRLLRNVTGPDALARFDRDVLAVPGARAVVLMEGINDIGRAFTPEGPQEPVTLAALQGAARQIAARAHDHGLFVIGATLTPYAGAHYQSPAGEAVRTAFNAWIRSGGPFDRVVDMDAVVRDPAAPTRIDPRLDTGDHLHFNDDGYRAMGDAIARTMLAPGGLPACSTR